MKDGHFNCRCVIVPFVTPQKLTPEFVARRCDEVFGDTDPEPKPRP